MRPLTRHRGGFRWEHVPVRAYKGEGTHFRDVTRQVLFGAEAGLAGELRYFEVAPGGHTTLERHAHPHAVVVVRGRGRVLVGCEIHDVDPYDLVHVPPRTWHQFRAADDQALGFLCLVDAARDRPERPDEKQLAALRREPVLAAFLRA